MLQKTTSSPNDALGTKTPGRMSAKPTVEARLIPEKGVLVVEPKAALAQADFDHLAAIADPWIEQHGSLNGLVLHARKFPGWESLGAMIQHMRFIKEHHRKVKRIAAATQGILMDLLPMIGAHFVSAEVKSFEYDELDSAIDWAAGENRP